MGVLTRVLTEPLVHFVLIGACLFGLFHLVGAAAPTPADSARITLSADRIAQENARFRQTWQRDPTPEELQGLTESLLREEILVREALALSMDENDAVIRRRLAQKMNFLIESAASAAVPSEAEVRAFFDENEERYARPGVVSFEQVYLGQTATEIEIVEALDALKLDNPPDTVGISTALPSNLNEVSAFEIDRTFGQGVHAQLETLTLGEWHAPVRSGFGFHVVRVTDRLASEVPPFDAVRSQVETDLSAEQSREMAEQIFARIRAQYEISLPDGANE